MAILICFLIFAAVITFYLSFKYSAVYLSASEDIVLPPPELNPGGTPPVIPETLVQPTAPEVIPSSTSQNVTNETVNTSLNISGPKVIATTYHFYIKDSPVAWPPLFDVIYTPPYVKIALPERHIFEKKYYDTIYIDRDKDLAVGFCEAGDCFGNTIKGVLLNYYTSDVLTPDEWLDRFKGAEKKESAVLVTGREVYYVKKQPYEGWIDKYYGLPLRVQEGTVDPLYFEYLEINDPALNATPKYGFTYDPY